MSPDPLDDEHNWVSANVSGQVGGAPLKMRVDVPKIPVHPGWLLPIYQQMTDAFVNQAVSQAEAAGKSVSCRAGCGACCRQLVPISEIEARQLSELVAGLPEPRRTEIHRRFEEARIRLRDANLLDPLQDPDRYTDETLEDLGREYFQLGIPCPFLEEESCSIHPDRPLACREYLVTSPAENCSRPTPATVDQVPMPAKMSSAVIRLSRQRSSRFIPYVPMILALDWVRQHPDELAPRTGPDILKSLIESLFGRAVNTADPASIKSKQASNEQT
jgi:Fe-S-cluster containining protein